MPSLLFSSPSPLFSLSLHFSRFLDTFWTVLLSLVLIPVSLVFLSEETSDKILFKESVLSLFLDHKVSVFGLKFKIFDLRFVTAPSRWAPLVKKEKGKGWIELA